MPRLPLRVIAAFAFILGFAVLLGRVSPAHFQPLLSSGFILVNGAALVAFLRRAWRRPEERTGWLLFALGVPLTLLAQGLLALSDPARQQAGPCDWLFLALSLALGLIQGTGLLLWPWRKSERAAFLFDLLGSLLFSGSIFLLLWIIGVWQAGFQARGVVQVATLALAGRLALTSGSASYLFSQNPRRIIGPLGWVLAALAMLAFTVALLMPLTPAGDTLDRAGPWFALALLAPICLLFAALSGHAAEAPPEVGERAASLAEAVPYVPFLVAGAVLGLALQRNQAPLFWPLMVFLGITGLLVLRQFLLLREVSAAKAQLEVRVAERTRSLEALQSVLIRTERMNAMATLGAGLAHDLNNLLSVIRNSAELMDLELGEGQAPSVRDLNRIMEAASRAGGLSHRLMAFGRRETPLAGAQAVEIAAAVEASREILGMMLPRNIQLDFEVGDPGGSRTVDPRALEQVLVNLVSNAKDAMPAGGRIEVRLRGAEAPGGGRVALLEVADTGPGIPEELQETVFEVFFTTKPEGRGTGLGLPSVRALVEAQGGTVSLESRPGKGTTFRLNFPLTP